MNRSLQWMSPSVILKGDGVFPLKTIPNSMGANHPKLRLWILKVKVAQSCPALCDPMGDTVLEILQARIRQWVAFSFFRGSPNPGIESRSPALQADSLPTELLGKQTIRKVPPSCDPNYGS